MYVCARLEVCLNWYSFVLSQLAPKLNFFAPFKIELTINNHLSSKPPNYVVLGNSKSRSAFYLFINIRYYFLISFPYSFFFFSSLFFPTHSWWFKPVGSWAQVVRGESEIISAVHHPLSLSSSTVSD